MVKGIEIFKSHFADWSDWRHIYVLAEKLNLPKRLFRNVVVFAGDAEIKTEVPDYVMSEYDVAGYIRSFESALLSDARHSMVALDTRLAKGS